jgi:cytochrome o ubiquinol oxidase subunit III
MSEVTALQQTPAESKSVLGFWVYLMTDCILFASLFATFAVLRNSTAGGPSGHDLFDLPFVQAETIILLVSSFTCGLGVLAARGRNKAQVLTWFTVTFLLGIAFLSLELTEFAHFASMGDSWERSAFLSSFFTLVGTHGLHIATGLLWMLVMMVRVLKSDLTDSTVRRLTLLGMFWHFLDVIWIFIFTIVYLMGVIS